MSFVPLTRTRVLPRVPTLVSDSWINQRVANGVAELQHRVETRETIEPALRDSKLVTNEYRTELDTDRNMEEEKKATVSQTVQRNIDVDKQATHQIELDMELANRRGFDIPTEISDTRDAVESMNANIDFIRKSSTLSTNIQQGQLRKIISKLDDNESAMNDYQQAMRETVTHLNVDTAVKDVLSTVSIIRKQWEEDYKKSLGGSTSFLTSFTPPQPPLTPLPPLSPYVPPTGLSFTVSPLKIDLSSAPIISTPRNIIKTPQNLQEDLDLQNAMDMFKKLEIDVLSSPVKNLNDNAILKQRYMRLSASDAARQSKLRLDIVTKLNAKEQRKITIVPREGKEPEYVWEPTRLVRGKIKPTYLSYQEKQDRLFFGTGLYNGMTGGADPDQFESKVPLSNTMIKIRQAADKFTQWINHVNSGTTVLSLNETLDIDRANHIASDMTAKCRSLFLLLVEDLESMKLSLLTCQANISKVSTISTSNIANVQNLELQLNNKIFNQHIQECSSILIALLNMNIGTFKLNHPNLKNIPNTSENLAQIVPTSTKWTARNSSTLALLSKHIDTYMTKHNDAKEYFQTIYNVPTLKTDPLDMNRRKRLRPGYTPETSKKYAEYIMKIEEALKNIIDDGCRYIRDFNTHMNIILNLSNSIIHKLARS